MEKLFSFADFIAKCIVKLESKSTNLWPTYLALSDNANFFKNYY